MAFSESIDLSCEPLAASLLSAEQKERLTELLDRYLLSLEEGQPLDPATLVAAHSDLAEPLQAYLNSLDELHCVAGTFGSANDNNAATNDELEDNTRRLGDFLLGRELGRGGMGIVYEARQISLDRTVALKVLPFAAVLDSKQIARFKSEAQAAAQIWHPNIVPVYAIGVDRGVHFYAMQFIDGQPLDRAIADMRERSRAKRRNETLRGDSTRHRSLIERDQPTSVALEGEIKQHDNTLGGSLLSSNTNNSRAHFRTVARLGIQASEALHAAHEYGVVHRDVKPSNLLLDHEGKLWVTDFGLARCQREATLSKTGDIVGTMRYMSPEQASGKTSLIDQRTDVYSLGVTLYELLALEPAVQGVDSPALFQNIDNLDPRSLRKLCPQIPTDLENVILKAMAKAREERYTTAQEFADDLRRFIDGKPTVAKPATTVDRIAKWTTRHRRVVAAAASVSILACIGFALSTLLISREKANTQVNFERAEKNFHEAQDAVHQLSIFAERLATVPAAGRVRRAMLNETLAYYEGFVEQAKDDPSLQTDLALTYSKIGSLTSKLGSADEAIAAHRRAINLFSRLCAASPNDLQLQQRHATSHNNLAMTFRLAGRIDEALAAHRSAISLQSRLARQHDDKQVASDLASSHANLGLLLSETGSNESAERSFTQAIEIQKQLVASTPNQADYHRDLAVSLNNLSAIYRDRDVERATKCYLTALKHQRVAVAAEPNNSEVKSELAATFNNLASLQAKQQSYALAAVSYEQAIQLQHDLLKSDSSRKSYRHDLAVSYNNQGLMESRLGNSNEAEQAFQQSITIQLPLVATHPDDVALRSSLGGVYNNLGIVLEEQSRWIDAASAYREAIEHQQVAFKQAPGVNRYRIFLSKHYFNFGRVLRKQKMPDGAVRVAMARRELWPGDGPRLLAVAEELAAATKDLLAASTPSKVSAAEARSYLIETLEQAVNTGYQLDGSILETEPFSVLRDDEQFLQLVNH